MGDLERTFIELYPSEDFDSVALIMLQNLEGTAKSISTDSKAMGELFSGLPEITEQTLEATQFSIAEKREELQMHRGDSSSSESLVAAVGEAHKTLTLLGCSRADREADETLAAAVSRERCAHRRNAWVGFVDDISKLLQPPLGVNETMEEVAVQNAKDMILALRWVDQIFDDRLNTLKRRSKAMADIATSFKKYGALEPKQILLLLSLKHFTLHVEL